MQNNRIQYIDYLKAFTIFTVILGHSIQAFHGSEVMGRVYSFIYSFHMPLFMTLSGFFIGSLLKRPLWNTAYRKMQQLLFPVLSFSLLVFGAKALGIVDFTEEMSFFPYAVSGGDMWFLKYLFVCIMVACTSKLIFRNTLLAALLPAIVLISISRVGIFRIYPFLWLGFTINHFAFIIDRYKKPLFISCALLFCILQYFWVLEYDYPNYRWITIKEGVSFDRLSLYVVSFRFLIGAVGSMSFIVLFRMLDQRGWLKCKFINDIGLHTLGIYCLQIFLLEKLFSDISIDLIPSSLLDIVIVLFAVFELLLCNGIVMILEKNKYTAWLLLGKIPIN